jgi:hypothetical protein
VSLTIIQGVVPWAVRKRNHGLSCKESFRRRSAPRNSSQTSWCTQLLHISLYRTVCSPPGHCKVHLKFGADLHIDLLGQSAEESSGSAVLHTHGGQGVCNIHTVKYRKGKYTVVRFVSFTPQSSVGCEVHSLSHIIVSYNRYHNRRIEPKRLNLVCIKRHF